MRFRGIYAPLTTPFNHLGQIYWSKFDYNLAQLRRTKLSGVVATDKWGEGQLLSRKERATLWKRAAKGAGDDAQVIAAIPGCGVPVAREEVAAAAACGCSAAVIEAPDTHALAPGAHTADLFFRAVADAADLPLLASVRMSGPSGWSAERLERIAAHPRIAGAVVEDAPAEAIEDLGSACGRGFAILVRDLSAAAPCLALGSGAALLSLAAAVPFFALSIEEAVRTREHAAAQSLAARATYLERVLAAHGVPALKHALDLRSYYGGRPRLPLLAASPGIAEAVSLALYELAS